MNSNEDDSGNNNQRNKPKEKKIIELSFQRKRSQQRGHDKYTGLNTTDDDDDYDKELTIEEEKVGFYMNGDNYVEEIVMLDENSSLRDKIVYYMSKSIIPTSCCGSSSSPGGDFSYNNVVILESNVVRLLKFYMLTLLLIILTHFTVRQLNWEHDKDYSLYDFITYDLNLITLDVIVFFIIGRLFSTAGNNGGHWRSKDTYTRPTSLSSLSTSGGHNSNNDDGVAVDTMKFILPTFLSSIYTSWTTNLSFMRYSFSLYEIHCRWPLMLWIYIFIIVLPIVICVIYKHIAYSIKHTILVRKLIEIALCLLIFIIPYVSHPNFHLHHWYFGWLVGMHCNVHKKWWSTLAMCVLFGQYINGIAVYGRDPILTCGVAFYRSTNQQCKFMDFYKEDDDDDVNNNDNNGYKPMEEPDWWKCTGYIP